MKRSLLLLLLTFVAALRVAAYDFMSEGIYYNIINDKEVAVTYRDYGYGSYSGDITIPATVTYSGSTYDVTAIDNFAFYYCSELTSIHIPEGVTTIGDRAFCGYCLTSINIPESVTTIGNHAFDGSNLTSIHIPEGVTTIGDYAFVECYSLTSINIPEGVTAIGEMTFSRCSRLTSINIPESVTTIGDGAFSYCSSLTSINFPESVTTIGDDTFSYCSSLVSINIPESVTTIGNSAFSGCSSLASINIPKSVTTIGNSAFYLCSSLTSINIPKSVTTIGNSAFYFCSSLASIIIPESVTTIGEQAFNATSLDKIIINSKTLPTLTKDPFNSTAVIFVPDAKLADYKTAWTRYASRLYPQSALETVAHTTARNGAPALLDAIGGVGHEDQIVCLKVEGTINGYDIMLMRNKLTNLCFLDLSDATIVPEANNYQYYTGHYTQQNVMGAYSFYQVDNLRTVVLPKNITSVGKYAFANCANLTQVTGMPETCTSIDSYAFSGKERYSSFCQSPKLTRVDIGEQVQSIGSYAFCGCQSLNNVKIPASVKTIGSGAFFGCTGLSSIDFGEGLETVADEAFYNCSRLSELRLPESLETINKSAFEGCSYLREIHIPSMLKSIGDNAFTGCTGAKDVYAYTLSPINISQNSFIYDGVTLHAPQVPESVFWDYYTNTQWSQFTNVVPFDAKYETWYLGENQDIVVGDGETIPNEDGEQAEGEMSPGSGLTYLPGAFQWLDKLKLLWKNGKFPAFIDNSNVFVGELTFLLNVQAGKWYFFCFPFDIELDKAKFNGKFVWRYYDGDERASNGVGGWKNIGGNKLNAFQGYIFQTNKSGDIELTITDPIFTGADKDIHFEAHASVNVQDAGWNFVGNPNLSYYDLSCFIDNFKCPITVWDPMNNTYNAITPGDDDYTFHPFEAFFVQKPTDTESMTFESEHRETSTQAEQTLQSRRRARAAMPIDESRRIVNLTLSDGTYTDKTRVVFNDEKALGYEPECDAAKFFSTESVPQLYTLDATTADKSVKFAINERPQADLRVALGVSIPADGTYTIAAPRMDQPMALLDRETGTIHDFNSDGDYSFLAKAGSHEDRFVLMPASSPTGVNALQTAGIKLEASDGGLSIAGLPAGTTATVYNAAGVMVASTTESGHCSLTPGTYVVTVGELSSKVVVK